MKLMLILVGGFNPPEKYWSVGMMIPRYGKIKNMFQTTNQYIYIKISIKFQCMFFE